MVKDLRLALDVYRHSASHTPITLTTESLFARAEARQGELDLPVVGEVLRDA